MNKPLSHTFIFVGVVLLLFGLNAGHSLAWDAREIVPGTPTERSVILILSGLVAIIVGGSSSFFRRHN